MRKHKLKTGLLAALILVCSGMTGVVQAQTGNDSRTKIVTIGFTNEPLREALFTLGRTSGLQLALPSELVDAAKTVNLPRAERTVEATLDLLLQGTNLEFQVQGNNIILSEKSGTPPVSAADATLVSSLPEQPRQVTGRVISGVTGETLPSVTVQIKGTVTGTVTNIDGNFTITVPSANSVLVFSFLGYETQELPPTEGRMAVRLRPSAVSLEGVVITGMFERRLESETGSSVRFSHEQLREAGNQNLVRSLSNLDASFMVMESLDFGSDPNQMPEIQMRGQSSFPGFQGEFEGNPNQPLFILDGFEATLQMIFDLDMNRVSSVTILKDASAKAIYGAKAGNGVVVIETIRPQRGQIRISYSSSLNIEVPDLTGYNLMDAREKLAFEKKAGMYTHTGSSITTQHELDRLYQSIHQDVLAGVNTHWLSQPLRVGIGHRNSLNFDGGDDRVLYGIGLGYNNNSGVMKGSGRNTLSGNMNISYTYKNFIFRNQLGIVLNNATNSPYGSFDQYALLNPYWRVHDDNGELISYWEWRNEVRHNPLYNATLNTKNTSKYTEIRNNFQMDWRIRPTLRATGRFSFTNNTGESDLFFPANHTMFINYTAEQSNRRGRYTKTYNALQSYQGDFGINYTRAFGSHIISTNATWNLQSQESSRHRYIAEGFSNNDMDDIAFGNQYMLGTSPSGSSNNLRSVGAVGALNYSFADRYLFDVSARSSASSMFGTENRWGHFWSLGLGWNMHREAFFKDFKWLNRFKIRGSAGYTGSQNFDPYMARARYQYSEFIYDGGYGAIILGLPNDNLKWQRVFDYNVGADIAIFNRINLKFDYFIATTEDLLTSVAIPPSTGFSTYMENLGKMENRGFDANISVRLWHNAAKRGWATLSVSGMHNKNTLKEISNTFEHRNNEQNQLKEENPTGSYDDIRLTYTRPSTLFYEGYSMTSIWGVRSAGINPVTGDELFYDRNGKIVTTWSALDQVVIGNTAPKLRGNINLSTGYRGFTFSVSAMYKFGGDRYNSTLVEKVEFPRAVSNFDRRITESWTEVGQMAPYRRLLNTTQANYTRNPTRPTSRFIMKDNELFFSSLSAGYDFQNLKSLSAIGIERLKLSFQMTELLRLSTIEIERGISYPFARTFSFSLQATF